MTAALLVLLALGLCAYVALPLFFPAQSDPLPDYSDPVLKELQEERDALFRAIRELEIRDDLADERRRELRARYEAKAAKVLRAIDERESEIAGRMAGRPAPARGNRVPYGAIALVSLAAVTASSMSSFVLPRVSDQQTVTTFFESDLEASRALRDLQRAAERDPTQANLLALADAYWQLEDAEKAEESYRALLETGDPPAIAFRRLGFLAMQRDLDEAAELLEEARTREPEHLQTLFTLGELHLARNDLRGAREAFQAFLEVDASADDGTVRARLEMIDDVEPLARAAEDDPSEGNLLALADAYWTRGERDRAVSVYFRLLTQVDPNSVTALARTAEALFVSGRASDALQLFERAEQVAASRGETLAASALLMMGNAHFSLENYDEAIDAWRTYLTVAEDPGRVPDLIASAEARLAGEAAGDLGVGGTPGAETQVAARTGRELYQANCAVCHGASGQGGSAPALVRNRRASDEAYVESVVRYGRGAMPGFGAVLTDEERQAIVDYVTDELSMTARDAP